MNRYVRTVVAAVALTVTSLCAPTAISIAAAADTVRLGQISISFYAVTGQVVQSVLERLGHSVELKTGSHAQIFPSIGDGSVDLLVAAWLPYAHARYCIACTLLRPSSSLRRLRNCRLAKNSRVFQRQSPS